MIGRAAVRHGIPRAPPYIPSSLRSLVWAYATTATTPGKPEGPSDSASTSVYSGKRVLVLLGGDDTVMPVEASRAFAEALDVGKSGRKEVRVMDGLKHEFTDGMRDEMFRFFWEEALVGGEAVTK